jgi:hypothetical protein
LIILHNRLQESTRTTIFETPFARAAHENPNFFIGCTNVASTVVVFLSILRRFGVFANAQCRFPFCFRMIFLPLPDILNLNL